ARQEVGEGLRGARPVVRGHPGGPLSRPSRRARSLALAVALAAVVLGAGARRAAAAPTASADGVGASSAETALARTYAPVMRLKEKPGSCDIGRPYEPTDIDVLMGNDEVALRGPWDRTNIVKVA